MPNFSNVKNLEPWISLGIHEVRWVFLFLFDTCSTLSTPYLGLTSVVSVSSSLCLCWTIYFLLQFHLWVTHFLAKLEVSFFVLRGLTPWVESKLLLVVVSFISIIFWVSFVGVCWLLTHQLHRVVELWTTYCSVVGSLKCNRFLTIVVAVCFMRKCWKMKVWGYLYETWMDYTLSSTQLIISS
jgi:hypothetical protein